MSQFAHDRPEEWLDIAALPPSQQNEALRAAMGGHPTGIPSRRRPGGPSAQCSNCGAPEDVTCQPWCLGEQYS